MSGPLVPKTP
uniref:Uncharacterized protein n=1 Tax=Anguilla anguilla TaxID=7936 RepID=A0A0E9U1D2_ANGAN